MYSLACWALLQPASRWATRRSAASLKVNLVAAVASSAAFAALRAANGSTPSSNCCETSAVAQARLGQGAGVRATQAHPMAFAVEFVAALPVAGALSGDDQVQAVGRRNVVLACPPAAASQPASPSNPWPSPVAPPARGSTLGSARGI